MSADPMVLFQQACDAIPADATPEQAARIMNQLEDGIFGDVYAPLRRVRRVARPSADDLEAMDDADAMADLRWSRDYDSHDSANLKRD